MSDIKELQLAIARFSEERDWDQFHNGKDLAIALSLEASELLECFQWNNNYDEEHVCEELADVMIYCMQMADVLGVDVKEIIFDKLEKNTEDCNFDCRWRLSRLKPRNPRSYKDRDYKVRP